jgi:hypothetical protein
VHLLRVGARSVAHHRAHELGQSGPVGDGVRRQHLRKDFVGKGRHALTFEPVGRVETQADARATRVDAVQRQRILRKAFAGPVRGLLRPS